MNFKLNELQKKKKFSYLGTFAFILHLQTFYGIQESLIMTVYSLIFPLLFHSF